MNNRKRIRFLLILTLLGLVSVFIYYAPARNRSVSLMQPGDSKLLAEVAQLVELPKNEKPAIATVTDPERLKSNPFFAKAQIGDKVIIYAKSGKAILYDPKNHKILDVAPITSGGLK